MNKKAYVAFGFVILVGLMLAFLVYNLTTSNAFCRIGFTAYNASGDRVAANYTARCGNTGEISTRFASETSSGAAFSFGDIFDSCGSYCGNVFGNASNASLNRWGIADDYPMNASNTPNWSVDEMHLNNITLDRILAVGNTHTFILAPSNGSSYYLNDVFNTSVLVNVSGGETTDCILTLTYNSSVLNVTSQNPISLGNLSDGFNQTYNFTTVAIGEGSSYINASTTCSLGVNSSDAVYDISVSMLTYSISTYLVSPVNATSSTNQTQTFVCNSTSGFSLSNMTLYVWNSTGLYYSNLKNVSGTFNESSWVLNSMPYGNYTWNCLARNPQNASWADSNWTLTIRNVSKGWNTFYAPQGIFEPSGGSYTGTHESTFGIFFTNLVIDSSDTLECTIRVSNGSLKTISETGITKTEENYSLNYTLQSGDSIVKDTSHGYLPWILKNCSIRAGSSIVYTENTSSWSASKSRRIYVHDAGYWDESEVTAAVACAGTPGVYFNNTAKCTFSEDTMYALQMRNGNDVEESCYNTLGPGCGIDYCKGIAFSYCDPLDFFGGYDASSDDPNGYTTFTVSFAGYNTPIAYLQYVNSSGNLKLRIGPQSLSGKTFSITIYNLTNVSEANVYGANDGGGTTSVSDNGDGTWNVAHNRLGSSFTGTLDFTFNISFNAALNEDRHLYIVIAYGSDTNQGTPDYFWVNFSTSNGLMGTNEAESTSWTTGFSEGPVCGDEVNNDFDYIGGSWSNSYDCFDPDCNMSQGDDSQTNEFGSGKTGLCNYAHEWNCTDQFDNDYDYIAGTGFTDCHDSDCFHADPACPSTETVCNDGINNDWDYTFGESDNSADKKIENNGVKYDNSHKADLTDCEDIDCNGQVGGSSGQNCEWGKELNCSDGFDNDALQLKDCDLSSVGGTTAMPTAGNAEYDCAVYCRAHNTSTETGSMCDDGLDNDWDAVVLTGNYSDQYVSNNSYGAGIDCRWGGYYGYGSNYNPDEDCNMTILSNGNRCELAKELNCSDGFDNDFDHDASGMPHAGWDQASYEAYFGAGTYSNDADFDDYDCQVAVTYNESTNASWCFDGIDNDLDAYFWNSSSNKWELNSSTGIDCEDPDCMGVVNPSNPLQSCAPYEYNKSDPNYNNPDLCSDSVDNDNDGATDCSDSDCFAQFGVCDSGQCKAYENVSWNSCFDGSNNDYQDGVDCADSDCVGMFGSSSGALCSSGETGNFSCSDGFDNDADGNVDCADSGCDGFVGRYLNGTAVYCQATESSCSDGFDNDADGNVDCFDSDCNSACGLSDISGTNPLYLPHYITGPSLSGNPPGASVKNYTRNVRKGEEYRITFRMTGASTNAEWTLGAATGYGPFNKSAFVVSSAHLEGPNAGDFNLSETPNGFKLNSNHANLPSGYEVTFVINSSSVLSSSDYELTYAEEQGSITSLNNQIFHEVDEDVSPVVDAVNVSPQKGIDYGSSLQIRANISDNNALGRCDFVVWGAEGTSSSTTSCRLSFQPNTEGTYYINVTPVDYYYNIGTTTTTTYDLDILPTGLSTTTDSNFYHPTDNMNFSASFNLVATDTLGGGSIYARNESGKFYLGPCSSSGNICSNSSVDLSSLGDGVYTVYAEVNETTEGDVVYSSGKGIFVCSGTGGICRFTDFDANGYADICVATPPSVWGLLIKPGLINQTNWLNVTVNASDDSAVVSVTARLVYPDFSVHDFLMSHNASSPDNVTYNLSFGETYQTGNYSVQIIAEDDSAGINDTTSGSFYVNVYPGFGNSSTQILQSLSNMKFNYSQTFNVSVNVSAVGGNLSMCNVSLNVNSSVFDAGDDLVLGNLSGGESNVVNFTVTTVGDGKSNLTATTYCMYGGSSYDVETNLSGSPSPYPHVDNLLASPSVSNQTDSVTITATVTSPSTVDSVLVVVTYPDSIPEVFEMSNIGGDNYRYIFGDTAMVGVYDARIIANNSEGYVNDTEHTNFTVNVLPGYGNSTTLMDLSQSSFSVGDNFTASVNSSAQGDLGECNVSVVSSNESVVVVLSNSVWLGNMSGGQSNLSSFNLSVVGNGQANISARTVCNYGMSSYNISLISVGGNIPDAPANFSIHMYNQTLGHLILNWSAVSGATGYILFYSDNITELLRTNRTYVGINVSNWTLVGASNTSYIDEGANVTRQRYYALASYSGSASMRNVSRDRVGKYDLSIASESGAGQTFLSIPVGIEFNVSDLIPSANPGCWIYAVNETGHEEWLYTSFSGSTWSGTFEKFVVGKGYYFDSFTSEINFTAYGKIWLENITRTIASESGAGQSSLGWESISSNGNISELIPSANPGCWIYAVNETGHEEWLYTSFSGSTWSGTFEEFIAGKAYYFDSFTSEINFTYQANPF